MLTPNEKAERVAALQALKTQGRISDTYIRGHKDEIAKVMDPLLPPWEWAYTRTLTGLTATAMEKRSGVHHMRIRHWERGGGTMYPETWVEYADSLADVVSEMGLGSAEHTGQGHDRKPVSASVRALVEQQRVASNALSVWLDQGVPCDPGDVMQLLESVRVARGKLTAAQKTLRDRLRQPDRGAQKQETGRKDNGNDTAH